MVEGRSEPLLRRLHQVEEPGHVLGEGAGLHVLSVRLVGRGLLEGEEVTPGKVVLVKSGHQWITSTWLKTLKKRHRNGKLGPKISPKFEESNY